MTKALTYRVTTALPYLDAQVGDLIVVRPGQALEVSVVHGVGTTPAAIASLCSQGLLDLEGERRGHLTVLR